MSHEHASFASSDSNRRYIDETRKADAPALWLPHSLPEATQFVSATLTQERKRLAATIFGIDLTPVEQLELRLAGIELKDAARDFGDQTMVQDAIEHGRAFQQTIRKVTQMRDEARGSSDTISVLLGACLPLEKTMA